ncbi:MAG: YdcF family protein [Lachnospiraceae bacterium]
MLWKIIVIFGILCLVYYAVMIRVTGTWKTTFSIFWLILGMVNLGFGLLIKNAPTWLLYVVAVGSAILWIVFVVVELMICFTMFSRPPKNLHCIIILGAQIRGTRVTDSLKRRLDRGLRYLHDNPHTMAVVSGGRGKGEDITEALAMQNYLVACGIHESRILLEDASTNTKENLDFSSQFLKLKKDKIGIVSNNFHMYRALALAKKQGYKHVYGIAASCKPIIFPNYMVREFFAVLQLQFLLRKE